MKKPRIGGASGLKKAGFDDIEEIDLWKDIVKLIKIKNKKLKL